MKKYLIKNRLWLIFVVIFLIICWYFYNKSNLTLKILLSDVEVVKLPLFEDKEYNLSLVSKPLSIVRELSKFGEDEKWFGDGEFDYFDYFEGKSSLYLASQNGIESEATLELKEKINPNDYKVIKFFAKINSDPSSIKKLKLIFSNNRSLIIDEYSIDKFKQGWNLLVIPVNESSRAARTKGFSKIIFKLVSQTSTSASINLDFLWAEKDDDYSDNWIARDDNFFFLKNYGQSLYFATTGNTGNLAVLKKITSADDYTVSIKFIPLREGFFGLFLRGDLESGYGYYFMVDGPGSDRWSIFKQGSFGINQPIILKEGKFVDIAVKKDLPFWVKMNVNKKHLIVNVSNDGEKFSRIGEVSDGSYVSGKVGIISGNDFLLLNDIKFRQ